MIRSRALVGGVGAAVLTLAAAAGSVPAASAQGPEPSLRLLAAEPKPTAFSRGGRVSLNQLGVYVGVSGADLRIDVARPDFGGWQATQVDGESGAVLREIPDDLLGERGLERFLHVKLTKLPSKTPAGGAASPFCPGGGARERLDDSGPRTPRYPRGCHRGFPFMRGKVWGIDAGWATRPQLGAVRLSPGRYRARIRVTKPYRDLFDIPREDAEVVVRVRVKRGSGHGIPIPRLRAAGTERPADDAAPAPLAAPAVDAPDPSTLPDPAALPLWNIGTHSRAKRDFLSFAASPWNAGPAPLVVEGYRRDGEDVMDAVQYFFDASGEVVGKAPAGTMEFHRDGGHNHWHFEQFVRFSLLKGGSKRVRSHKQSFCIVPTDAVDLTVAGAEWRPGERGGGSSCGRAGSIWIREELPAGWADTYYQSVSGQAFNITRVPNGRYRVRMHVNPRGELHEVTDDNNVVDRIVRLRGNRGARTVTVHRWNGIAD